MRDRVVPRAMSVCAIESKQTFAEAKLPDALPDSRHAWRRSLIRTRNFRQLQSRHLSEAETDLTLTKKGTTLFMLQAGNSFPNFSLPNQDGRILKLSDFKGQWLVVYFYPKDDTPGFTIQGKS